MEFVLLLYCCIFIYKLLFVFQGTSCTLSLPRKQVGDEDIVRIVFSCHVSTPSGEEVWGEEVGKPVEAKQKLGISQIKDSEIFTQLGCVLLYIYAC